MKVARVFATKTSMCPTDQDSYFGGPDLFTPDYDEVNISVTFTWAIKRGYELKEAWKTKSKIVNIGGCALNSKASVFVVGKYLKRGVTITSRGCPNNCDFCYVPKREGTIIHLPIFAGHIIQDNNLLCCDYSHIRKVMEMLKKQKHIDFSGGFQADRVTDNIIEQLRNLKIYQIWLAYDSCGAEKPLKKAVERLSKYFKRDQIRCYVLIGYKNDTLEKAESRLKTAYAIGTLPFAMRYRNDNGVLFKERGWNLLQRQWDKTGNYKINYEIAGGRRYG